jgi:hypothetical protein
LLIELFPGGLYGVLCSLILISPGASANISGCIFKRTALMAAYHKEAALDYLAQLIL